MKPVARWKWTARAAAFLLLLNACTSSQETSGSPLVEYFGSEEAGSELWVVNAESEEQAAAEFTRQCMKELGFEFTPYPVASRIGRGRSIEGFQWGTEEWMGIYGLGVSTQAFPQDSLPPSLVGQSPGPDSQDTNFEYVMSLGEADRDKYMAALFGTESAPIGDPDLSDAENSAELEGFLANRGDDLGCIEFGYSQVPGTGISAVFDQFSVELADLDERIDADPRVIESQSKIDSCVRAEIGDYQGLEAAFSELEESVAESFGASDRLSEDELVVLGELQVEERRIASVLVGCGATLLVPNPGRDEVRFEYEQGFIRDNEDELSRLRGD